jgi:hypothetical protein
MNTPSVRERTVKSWIESSLKTGGIERYDDLHVDQIDPSWKKRDRWMEAGFEALKLALKLKERYSFPADVTLAFSLLSGDAPRGVNFKSEAELKDNFDWSPPSLYLLRPGTKPWSSERQDPQTSRPELAVTKIDLKRLGITHPFMDGYCVEFKPPGSSEYHRTFFFMGVKS